MDVKNQLKKIIKEHSKLTFQHNAEEQLMEKKRYKENEAEVDQQAPAKVSPDESKDGGGPMQADTPQNHEEVQAENLAEEDTQAPAEVSPDSAEKNPLDADTPQDKREVQDEQPMKESEGEEDEPMQESEGEEEPFEEMDGEEDEPMSERFREMEDDMGKMTDVLEALKNQLDDQEKRMSDMEERFKNQASEEPEEEPDEPMSESAILKGAFKESFNTEGKKEELGKTFGNLLKKTF